MNTPPKPPMPEQPKTKEIPRVVVPFKPATLDDVLVAIRRLTDSHDSLMSAQVHTTDLVLDLAAEVGEIKRRQDQHSVRAKQPSEHDLAAAAELAKEIAARQSLAAKVDALDAKQDTQLALLERLNSVAAHPMVRRIAYALGGLLLAYLAGRGH